MTLGLPGSGKSTWAKKYLSEHSDAVRVNKDELRLMIHNGEWSRKKEGMIIEIRDAIIIAALNVGKTVIVDDTNFAPNHRMRLSEIALQANVPLQVVSFTDVPLKDCIANDLKRDRSVGKDVIVGMYNRYLSPKPTARPTWVDGAPEAIICDLDGTLAHMTDRGPFDERKCGSDRVDESVANLVRMMAAEGKTILYVSGRKDYAYAETMDWLKKNDLVFDGKTVLMMRVAEDNRPDNIIKREIYDELIKGKYNVNFVLDDRNQVVEMWRSLGLKCLQVEMGDF